MRKADESSKTKRAVEKAIGETVRKSVISLYKNGIDINIIALSFELSIEQVKQILNLND
jgi:hypothetical protein